MITDYLLELIEELRVPPRQRRRIVAEVEDHLLSAAADLHADGLDVASAQSEAIRRFGPAAALAASFTEEEAARAGRRVARATGVLTGGLVLLTAGPLARMAPFGGLPVAALAFVLGQVGVVAGALTVLRGWRLRETGPERLVRLTLLVRGADVVLACLGGIMLCELPGVVASISHWTVPVLIPRLLAAGALVPVALAVLRGRRRAQLAGLPAPQAGDSASDPVAELAGATRLALERATRRLPALRGPAAELRRLLEVIPAYARRRAPRLTRWLDLRRHPWRFALTSALGAGLLLAGGHAFAEGPPTAHVALRALVASVLIAGFEGGALLLGFATLGRFLGLRPPPRALPPG
ncbi:MAG TPA: permease prefix domain 1-containing protein [Solirubrobacteraceae bacterium]|nr:permease prefix domain 1-containing protein [Solirubrobacteraceae bacterium]